MIDRFSFEANTRKSPQTHASCPGLARASTTFLAAAKTWMAGPSPAMT
jgi:hypothetical protein